ncbi:hypothetical protein BH10PSE10_BH10PSE10_24350 [soil metagenome]
MSDFGSVGIKRTHLNHLLAIAATIGLAFVLAQPAAHAALKSSDPLSEVQRQHTAKTEKDSMTMADNKTSPAGAAEMAAAKTITMKVLAIGTWTAKATPETRPPIMPSEARDTMRLMLAGKIDQWFAKIDGSGAVFLMNVTDPAEAHALLEKLPLGQANMMTFELIPVGPLWPLGLLLGEPAK